MGVGMGAVREFVSVGVIVIGFALAAVGLTPEAQQPCGPSPGPGWVCQDGGWLPPGHPAIRPVGPAPVPPAESPDDPLGPITWGPGRELWSPVEASGPNADLITAARFGTPWAAGARVVTAPLRLSAISTAASAGQTILQAPAGATGAIVVMDNMGGMVASGTHLGYPPRVVLQDVTIQCSGPGQIGLVVRAAAVTLDRVMVVGCDIGVRFDWAVNVTIRDSLFTHNGVGLDLAGYGPSGLTGPTSITTVRVRDSRIAASWIAGVRLRHGLGVLFDNVIIEGNSGVGMLIEPAFEGAVIVATLRDVWFEANGAHLAGRVDLIRQEGMTNGY